ncbi:MAG: hypothetical protein LBO06_04245 [Bacteroidales bacterium]|nr:hypothetical protein [Bacteroidales bacterium]
MKVKHLLLGIAIVALMAACGKKDATDTPTTTPEGTEAVEEQPVQEPAATPAAQPKSTTTAQPAAKAEEPAKPAVNPCEQKVKDFESYVAELKVASSDRIGAAKLRHFAELRDKSAAQKSLVESCASDETYGARVKRAFTEMNAALVK